MADAINPDHYKWLPIEVIEITEHLDYCLGNVVKYVLRCDHKGEPLQDLRKAAWYLDREIARREAAESTFEASPGASWRLPIPGEDLLGPFTTPGWTACGHSRSLRVGCPGCAALIDDEQFVRGEE